MPDVPPIRGKIVLDFSQVAEAEAAVSRLGSTMGATMGAGGVGGKAASEMGAGLSQVRRTAEQELGPSGTGGIFSRLGSAMGGIGTGIKEMSEKTTAPMREVRENVGNMAQSFGLGQLAVLGAGIGIESFATEAVAHTEEVGQAAYEMSVKFGLVPEMASRWIGAAGQLGLSSTDVSNAFKFLSKNMEQVNLLGDRAGGSAKGVAEAFRSLGVPVKDSTGHLRDTNAMMLDVADRFASMPDGAEKAGLAMKLFGRGGQTMIEMLNEGSDGIKELQKNSDEMGTTLSTKQVKAAHDAYLAHQQFNQSIAGLSNTMGETLLPILAQAAKAMTPVVTAISHFIETSPAGRAAVIGLAGAFAVLAGVMVVLAIAMLGVTWPLLLIAVAIGALIALAYLVITNWGPIAGFFRRIWGDIAGFFQAAWVRITKTLQDAWAVVSGVFRRFGPLILMLMGPIGILIGAIVLLVTHWGQIVAIATRVATVVRTVLGAAFTFLATIVRAVAAQFLLIGQVVWAALQLIFRIFLVAFAIWLGAWVMVFRAVATVVTGALAVVTGVMNAIMGVVVSVWTAIWGFLGPILGAIWATVSYWWNQVVVLIEWALQRDWALVQAYWNLIWGFLSGIFTAIWTTASYWWNLLSSTIETILQRDWAIIQAIWNAVWNFLAGVWTNIYNTASYWWNQIAAVVVAAVSGLRTTLEGIWAGIVAGASTVGTQIWTAIKNGLNEAIRLANVFINAANTALQPLNVKINTIPALARGGRTEGPTYLVGEGRAPEYVIPTDSTYRGNARNLWLAAGHEIGMLAEGGVIGDLLSPVSSAVSNALNNTGPGWAKDIATNFVNFLLDKLKSFVTDHLQQVSKITGGGSGGGPAPSGQLGDWINAAIALTHVGANWAGPLATLIGRESGGNPRAINLWDSNAQAGDPSRGLMQTIGSTFEHYRSQALPDDIYDPVANIVAGINYIISRYGSIFNVQQAVGATPQGYMRGGILFDQGGIWRSGTLGYNASGRSEWVASGDQVSEMVGHLRTLAGRGMGGIQQNFYGGKADPQEFMRAADWYARTGQY